MGLYLLVGGLLVFSILHLATATKKIRRSLVGYVGELPYKGIFALLSLVSFGVALHGYSLSPYVELWQGGHVLILLQSFVIMPISIVLLVSSYISKGTRRITRHPMLAGVALACFGHVLVNGDLAFVTFFGGLGIYAVSAMFWSDVQLNQSAKEDDHLLLTQTGYLPSLSRLERKPDDLLPRLGVLGPTIGAVAYGLALTSHSQVIGISPLASLVN